MDKLEQTAVWIALAGSLKPKEIQTVFDRSAEGVFFHNPNEVAHELGLSTPVTASPEAFQDQAKQAAERFLNLGGFVLTRRDEGFPYNGEFSAKLPPLLFATGTPEAIRARGLAVVGTRKASAYGKQVAHKLGLEAARRGRALISGAALGIDAAGHQGALDGGGPTVAVMGSGHFHPYPARHKSLYEQIREQGLVLSQFAPDTPPLPHTFPVRNRIIALLSRAVVIVEGGKKSGSRHTAQFAEKDGIPIYAVPGALDKPGSELPNLLISEGHSILHRLDLCFREFDTDEASGARPSQARQGELPLGNPKPRAKPQAVQEPTRPKPEGLPGRLLDAIGSEEVSIDTLLALSPDDPNAVNTALLQLELDGWIQPLPGKRFVQQGRLR